MTNEGIPNDLRSREDEYFRRKDRELVEKMREAAAREGARQELGARAGLQDPALVQELEALGFTPETVSLLPLVPIVQVAWAEGGVSDAERTLIVRLARQRGVEAGTEADQQLAEWLATKPDDEVFSRATRLIRAMLDTPEGEASRPDLQDLIAQCEAIAAASGGILGFGKISAEERALLGQIESTLKSK